MFKILTRNKIADCGLNELPKENFSISDNEKSPDAIMLRSYVLPEEELTSGLLAIGRAGAGTNNIPVDACAEKGIVVFNTPGANANGVKEIVITGLLLASRDIVGGINWSQSLVGSTGVAKAVEKGKAEFVGPEISGKKLGVIGLGAIGVLVANACRSLGMSVVGYDPFISVDAAWGLSRGVRKAPDLDSLLAECDYISLHVPVNKDTKGMFNKEMFAKCKKGMRIVNSARAELVEDAALLAAIDDGTVFCYVTDFPTENMLGHKRIVPIPHLGASTPESEDNCATMAAAQLREYLMHGNIKNSVNFPNCELPYSGKKRICVIHRNLPKVINPVTTILGERGINIDNMVMKSSGDFAYVIIDVDCPKLDGMEEEISKMNNIINVRVI
ncbi:MAG: 3-phosphoglycerate dehydrogenase family protein [Defluviitaleaceae bacterium]|nr:3-phosphoglycerate dehydrogenase family protein [Defluviitaleaceae bacterium]MCL2263281.1 3-phosphoglycerate dehydrogenase family protein [Defluviitaleaceae bacterium]